MVQRQARRKANPLNLDLQWNQPMGRHSISTAKRGDYLYLLPSLTSGRRAGETWRAN